VKGPGGKTTRKGEKKSDRGLYYLYPCPPKREILGGGVGSHGHPRRKTPVPQIKGRSIKAGKHGKKRSSFFSFGKRLGD